MSKPRRQPKPIEARPPMPQEVKDSLLGLLTTDGWRNLERLLSEEINIAIAANLRVGAEHDYFIGVVDGLSVIFDTMARANEKLTMPTKTELVRKLDPATSGWLGQFKSRCKHPAVDKVDNPALKQHEFACRSCGSKWVEAYTEEK